MVGLFLCGDFTDRAQLMRLVDSSNIQSGIGFTDAKRQQGFFPTSPYLVVTRDWRDFLKELRLQLSVNNEVGLRMKASTKRNAVRTFHLIGAVIIGAYVYSPWKELEWFSFLNKAVIIPGLTASGLWMWQGHRLRTWMNTKKS